MCVASRKHVFSIDSEADVSELLENIEGNVSVDEQ